MPARDSIFNISICSNQLPYSWNGNTYSSAGTFRDTLISANGCDSVVSLNLSVNNTITSNTAVGVCLRDLPYSWNGCSYSSPGIYFASFTSSGGCDSLAILTLTVKPVRISNTFRTDCPAQIPYQSNSLSISTPGAGRDPEWHRASS